MNTSNDYFSAKIQKKMKLCFIFLFNCLIVELLSVIPRLTRDPFAKRTDNSKGVSQLHELRSFRST